MTKTVYACGVAWQHEIGETDIRVYPTIKDLKSSGDCWLECGIVELKVSLQRWRKKQDFKLHVPPEFVKKRIVTNTKRRKNV